MNVSRTRLRIRREKLRRREHEEKEYTEGERERKRERDPHQVVPCVACMYICVSETSASLFHASAALMVVCARLPQSNTTTRMQSARTVTHLGLLGLFRRHFFFPFLWSTLEFFLSLQILLLRIALHTAGQHRRPER